MTILRICAVVALSVSALAADIDFNRDIRPLLSQNCFACHGPDAHERKAKLRLDTREGAVADRGDGAAIVPGDAAASAMVARLRSHDPDELMPPPETDKTLDPVQIQLLADWIDAGAEYSAVWTYVPPVDHPVPEVGAAATRNWIDRFVLARLQDEGLAMSPAADPATLVRRLSFDLTGLPPTPEDVEVFAADADTPEAWERLVDRLLASGHYGERMAMYWLDLVRYADTVGYHGDQDQNISPYRDYVIDAFNRNLPYDQFTREQLAGDLLPDATVDQKVASGYNRMLQTSHEGGVQPKEYLAIYAADRVRNVSAVWMGATLGCAQCHDHKYDPYTMKDFYSMASFFADLDEAQHFKVGSNSLPTKRPPEIKVLSRRERERLAELDAALAGRDDPALRKERETLAKRERLTMVSVAIEPRTMRVLPRGNWLDDSGEVVTPAVPAFLGPLEVGGRRPTRLDLAAWLCDPEDGVGGLTARVMVNRLWYLCFGSGLSRSLDDFGGQGEPPRVFPELLDKLAVEFVRSGWDVKHMMRLMVTSRAYRQSSLATADSQRRDPGNQLLARQSRHRLPAEMIRDQALAVSGLLVDGIGGPSAKPYQPPGYYRHLNFPTRKYKHDTGPQQWRRGVYVHWQRQFLHPMLKAFDAPSREECTAQRPRSNTPTAAMVLLNDPSFVEAARALAERLVQEDGEDTARLRRGFLLLTSRPPDTTEQGLLNELLRDARAAAKADPAAAKALADSGTAPRVEGLDDQEVAAWTTVARALLNLHEAITRN